MKNFKGYFASVSTAVSTTVSWMTTLDVFLRFAISMAGLFAAYHAAHYWREKRLALQRQRQIDDEPPTTKT